MQKTETYTNVWNFLTGAGMTDAGAAGLMGNLFAKSGIIPNRVEILCLQRLKEHGKNYTDQTYTAAVDNGNITREEFLHPLPGKVYGYGIAQWTSPDRKGNLYDYCMGVRKSIGDLKSQLAFLVSELAMQYPQVLKTLQSAVSVGEASDSVLMNYEQPANASSMSEMRASYGMDFYDLYHEENGAKNGKIGGMHMTKIEAAIQWMENAAKDNLHGYDQTNRWGPDYDCSSAVITAWEQAGVKVKSGGATYTGNMLPVFLKYGFVDVTSKVNLATGAGLVRGDVLLNTVHHTAMYCGGGKEVEASINEKGRATGGATGDQTGREFWIRSYRNYPWDTVLRYNEGGSSAAASGSATTTITASKPAASFDKTIGGAYDVTASSLNVRDGGSMGDKIIGALPRGSRVMCYGYYTGDFFYIQSMEIEGVVYTGFCSKQYLKKV